MSSFEFGLLHLIFGLSVLGSIFSFLMFNLLREREKVENMYRDALELRGTSPGNIERAMDDMFKKWH